MNSETPTDSTPASRLLLLVKEFGLKSEDLDEFVYDMANEIAADRVNAGKFPDEEDWDDAYDRLHDEADHEASEINNGDLESQIAYLLGGNPEEVIADLLRCTAADQTPTVETPS